jgi:hypothetical protein
MDNVIIGYEPTLSPDKQLKHLELYSGETIKEWVSYDPETGIFNWIKKPSPRVRIFAAAGSLDKKLGYVSIMLDRQSYLAHRMAFVYMTGKLPMGLVDHINGIRSDNRWINLRDATHSINQQNQKLPRSNCKSGALGVTKNGKGFRATVGFKDKNYYSPTFNTLLEASAAYFAMKKLLHKGFVEH